MNETQFNLLASRLIKSTVQRQAVKLSVLHGVVAADAERRTHGRITSTVARDAARINELFDFCKEVAQ